MPSTTSYYTPDPAYYRADARTPDMSYQHLIEVKFPKARAPLYAAVGSLWSTVSIAAMANEFDVLSSHASGSDRTPIPDRYRRATSTRDQSMLAYLLVLLAHCDNTNMRLADVLDVVKPIYMDITNGKGRQFELLRTLKQDMEEPPHG
jgi:hypothetical protein